MRKKTGLGFGIRSLDEHLSRTNAHMKRWPPHVYLLKQGALKWRTNDCRALKRKTNCSEKKARESTNKVERLFAGRAQQCSRTAWWVNFQTKGSELKITFKQKEGEGSRDRDRRLQRQRFLEEFGCLL